MAQRPYKRNAEKTRRRGAADKDPLGSEPRAKEKPNVSFTAPALPEGVQYIWGTGRRKKSIARVRIRPGAGKIIVNKRDMEQFFTHQKDRQAVVAPLTSLNMLSSWDVWVDVGGGGSTGQADAVKLGLARALAKALPEAEGTLRNDGLMTRDARIKERKKYGQPGARKRFQFSKR